MNRRLAQAKRK